MSALKVWAVILLLISILAAFIIVHPSKHLKPETVSRPDVWSYYHGKTEEEVLEEALRVIKMGREDLWLKWDVVEDPFRLGLVNMYMEDPLAGVAYAESFSAEVAELSVSGILVEASKALGLETDYVLEEPDFLGEELGKLPKHLRNPVKEILGAALISDGLVREAFAGLDEEEFSTLVETAPLVLREDVGEEVDEKEFLELSGKVDVSKLVLAAKILTKAIEENLDELRGKSFVGDRVEVETGLGRIVVGGARNDNYPCEAETILIIDFGGEDTYGCAGSAFWPRRVSIAIDLGGDDNYLGEDYVQGSGVFGVGLLYDLGGDDLYQARHYSQGSGLFGVGIVVDELGDDTYKGDTCTQGSGVFGVGVSLDREGNDSYRAALFSQGFGFTKGFGFLMDNSGNDMYYAGGEHLDILRYTDHYLSLSQGFGFGLRPHGSGGIGFLLDRSGNDTYYSDIFGQGACYWFSLGFLVDMEGNDYYQSFQYAQGSACHLCTAVLVDQAGNDVYFSKGVSQGCGHDIAAGILVDRGGNDSYTAADLSQGAANANAIGLIIENGGNDSYVATEAYGIKDITQGYGDRRRDFGNIGMILDLSGEDKYSEEGRKNNHFYKGSTYGVVADVETKPGGEKDG